MPYAAQAYSDEHHKPSHPFDNIQSQLFTHFMTGQRALQDVLHDVTQKDEYYMDHQGSVLSSHSNSRGGSVPEWRLQTESIELIQDLALSYDIKLHQLLRLLTGDTYSPDDQRQPYSHKEDHKHPHSTNPATTNPPVTSVQPMPSHNQLSQDVPIKEATEQTKSHPTQPSYHLNHTVGDLDLNDLIIMNIVLIIGLLLIVLVTQQSK
ncbi:MAG: hypothetical protein Q9199_007747 [Rusavskia elegans]